MLPFASDITIPQTQALFEIERRRRLRKSEGPRKPWENKYIPHKPTERQLTFLECEAPEVFFGGAAGPGKTDALLMAGLRHVEVPGYAGLIIRKTFKELTLPGAIQDRAAEWLGPTDARWNGEKKRWTFPSGAKLVFGHLEDSQAHYGYQGTELDFLGIDELTGIPERQYRYLLSRLRRLKGSPIKPQALSASNPGGRGHAWVKKHFVDWWKNWVGSDAALRGEKPERVFIPAKIEDNPYLDREDYVKRLGTLDTVDRRHLLHGDWDARREGNICQADWFTYMNLSEVRGLNNGNRVSRYWDFAATAEDESSSGNPDYTVGSKCSFVGGVLYVWDIQRIRESPVKVERVTQWTAEADGPGVDIWIEQEPGASGKQIVDHFKRNVLQGYAVRGDRKTGAKRDVWKPFVALAEDGKVVLVNASWNDAFIEEVTGLEWKGDNGVKDDQMDTVAGCFGKLTRKPFLIS